MDYCFWVELVWLFWCFGKAFFPTTNQPSKAEIKQLFPLKPANTFSSLVKRMQEALINFGGMPKAHIASSGGADGIFGAGTKRALEAYGTRSDLVTETTYAEILKKGGLL